jgi:acyl-ACP thioesterase
MSTIKHKEDFNVRSYELSTAGKATLPVIANYFQEAAGKNARDLNFDIEDLHSEGVTWVLYRMHIKMESFPGRWEHVTVNTWPSSGDGIRAFRDYQLVDESGNVLGKGISQWMVLDMNNRRPVRIPKEILEMGLEVPDHQLPVDKAPFPEMDEPDLVTKIDVGRHHLDMNKHVNNVIYIEWMTGFMGEKVQPESICTELKLQYHKECSLGQTVEVRLKTLDNKRYLHLIVDAATGNKLAEGVSIWK